ncbi:hypothetical protein EVB79_047 [Rhizobium phage RHph_N3_13]|nr:hypothetical protein EVB79_047 [Rhizobium phage RHph_N3_13]
MCTTRVVIQMRIFDKIFEWYENWRYSKKFKIGDRVRYTKEDNFWQELEVREYDFYYKGWWIYLKDLGGYSGTISLKEHELELILQEYKYDQSGDTEDDI